MSISFTDEEKEILNRLSCGETIQNIADAMNVTTLTIDTRLHYMRSKIGARNNVHLIAIAVRSGWIES